MTMTLDDYNERILKPLADKYEAEAREELLRIGEQRLIANVAIAIGNKLAENGISISLQLAPELAKVAIEVIKRHRDGKDN